ncbi:unnamed protein product [Acanthosepion pharaonis]|uniref:Uncharacterized protein n=1 Tax=Acanthosepion pharaonis TaxID=158019 RepID=A0A812D9H5_ACAPH|nr:unnamed protein product [Sepia pharaonis]
MHGGLSTQPTTPRIIAQSVSDRYSFGTTTVLIHLLPWARAAPHPQPLRYSSFLFAFTSFFSERCRHYLSFLFSAYPLSGRCSEYAFPFFSLPSFRICRLSISHHFRSATQSFSSRPSPAADRTQHQQKQLFKQSFSRLTSESHLITTLRGSTHFTLCYCLPSETPAHSCSFQLTPAAFSSLLQLITVSSSLLQLPAVSSSPLQLPAISSSLLQRFTDVQRPVPTSGYRSRTNDFCRLSTHCSQIKTRFLSSTTDHLRLSSFFAIAISLPLCPLFSCTVDWHSHLSARCNKRSVCNYKLLYSSSHTNKYIIKITVLITHIFILCNICFCCSFSS